MTSAVTGRRSNQLSYEAVAYSLKQPSVYITQIDHERKSETPFGVSFFTRPSIASIKPCNTADSGSDSLDIHTIERRSCATEPAVVVTVPALALTVTAEEPAIPAVRGSTAASCAIAVLTTCKPASA